MKTLPCNLSSWIVSLALLTFIACQPTSTPEVVYPKEKVQHYTAGPAQFIKGHQSIRTTDGDEDPLYTTGDRMKAFKKATAGLQARSGEDLDWKARGPGNVGGRTRGLVVDPADPSARTWFLASVGGGIWKTTDAGNTWELLTNNLTSLSTSTIAMAMSNQDVMYIGTGEGFGSLPEISGTGIWKSTDRGTTWDVLDFTAYNNDFANVTRLIVNPDDENEIYASTLSPRINGSRTSNIFKSTDGGMTWESKYMRVNNSIQQIVPSPDDFNTLYATVNSIGVVKTTDGGDNWEIVWNVQDQERRIEMAIAPNDPGVIYLSCQIPDGSRMYFTRDTFNTVNRPVFEGRQPNWLANQGWYDNTIAVHPYNDSIVYVAGQGTIMEIQPGTEQGSFTVYDDYTNLSFFIAPIENGPFQEEPAGPAISLFEGLPVNLELTPDDVIDVELRFGPDKRSFAHLISVNLGTFQFSFSSMIEVPFEAWDTTNNRQIAMSIVDVDQSGDWTFEDYSDMPDAFHDVVLTNNVDYAVTPNANIENNNALYKAQYFLFMGRSQSYNGMQDTLPSGTFIYRTREDAGLISDFVPVTDAYSQYTDVAAVGTKGVHPDHHNLVMIPRDSASGLFYILNANDGGIAFSDNGGETFEQTSGWSGGSLFGYNTSQFYGVDKKNGENQYIGGTQDNGSWVSPVDPDSSSIWQSAPSGDGFEAAWHYGNTDLVLETSQFNNLFKSTDGGNSWFNVQLPASEGPFVSRVASSQLNPDLVFMVSDSGVLRSTDFADSWEVIDMPSFWSFNGSWGPPITISLADPNYVWTGNRVNGGNRMCYSSDGGLTFQETSNYLFATLGTITGVATHPSDPNTAYTIFSQKNGPKILRTTDLGATWTDITGFVNNATESSNGFPNVAVYSLLVMPWDENVIWAGTEIGLFESSDAGETWEYADNGLPPLSIWQIKIVNDEIILATHGRGIWTLNTEELQPVSVANPEGVLPGKLAIFPNPLTEKSTVKYHLDKSQNVVINLISAEGKQIREIYAGQKNQGEYSIELLKKDLTPGMYVVHLQGEYGQLSRKLVVR